MEIPYGSTFIVMDMQTSLGSNQHPNEVPGEIELEALQGPVITRELNKGVVGNINRRIEEFRSAGSKIVFVNYAWEGRLLQEIDYNPRADKLIEKPGNDGFDKTSLADVLRSYGNRNLVFAGAHANACLRTSVGSAIEILKPEGYSIYVVKNCVVSTNVCQREEGLRRMRGLGAILI